MASIAPNFSRVMFASSAALPALARSLVANAVRAPARSHSAATAFSRARPASSAPCPCSIRHWSLPASRRATAAPMPDPPPVMMQTRITRLQQLALRQILHQRADPDRPRLAIMAGAHAVDELAELGRGDGNEVVALVGKSLPRRIAILH